MCQANGHVWSVLPTTHYHLTPIPLSIDPSKDGQLLPDNPPNHAPSYDLSIFELFLLL
jgi:hypothetical protein